MITALTVIGIVFVCCLFAITVTAWSVGGHIHEAVHKSHSGRYGYKNDPNEHIRETSGWVLGASLFFPIAVLYGIVVRMLGFALPQIREKKAEERAKAAEKAQRQAELETARLMAEIKSFDPEAALERAAKRQALTQRR